MAPREYLILSATEPDRTGLIADLTGFIGECGCNVEDSRVVVLGGYAGLMLLISGASEAVNRVVDRLEVLREQSGIRAVVRRIGTRRPAEAPGVVRLAVQAHAIDHEGIIHALADIVRRHGGNILELETSTESAPMSGEPLFAMRMTVALPDRNGSAERLERELKAVARAQAMEIEARHLGPGAIVPPVGPTAEAPGGG